MAQGRGSAMTVAVTLLVVLLVHSAVVDAVVYNVGASGWSFNSVAWTNGKKFRAGDVLVFKYNPSFHNVVKVDRASFNACKTPRGAPVFKSGKDSIKLTKGANSFICNFPGHCESGMKITINAA
ncbi:hypothetical protein ACHQM5_016535 [Ranunculus cassubicifolius]